SQFQGLGVFQSAAARLSENHGLVCHECKEGRNPVTAAGTAHCGLRARGEDRCDEAIEEIMPPAAKEGRSNGADREVPASTPPSQSRSRACVEARQLASDSGCQLSSSGVPSR